MSYLLLLSLLLLFIISINVVESYNPIVIRNWAFETNKQQDGWTSTPSDVSLYNVYTEYVYSGHGSANFRYYQTKENSTDTFIHLELNQTIYIGEPDAEDARLTMQVAVQFQSAIMTNIISTTLYIQLNDTIVFQLELRDRCPFNQTISNMLQPYNVFEVDLSQYNSTIQPQSMYNLKLYVDVNMTEPLEPGYITPSVELDNIMIYYKYNKLIDYDIYVDPLNGNDLNNGSTVEFPLLSIQKAIDIIDDTLGLTIYIMGDKLSINDTDYSIMSRGKYITLQALNIGGINITGVFRFLFVASPPPQPYQLGVTCYTVWTQPPPPPPRGMMNVIGFNIVNMDEESSKKSCNYVSVTERGSLLIQSLDVSLDYYYMSIICAGYYSDLAMDGLNLVTTGLPFGLERGLIEPLGTFSLNNAYVMGVTTISLVYSTHTDQINCSNSVFDRTVPMFIVPYNKVEKEFYFTNITLTGDYTHLDPFNTPLFMISMCNATFDTIIIKNFTSPAYIMSISKTEHIKIRNLKSMDTSFGLYLKTINHLTMDGIETISNRKVNNNVGSDSVYKVENVTNVAISNVYAQYMAKSSIELSLFNFRDCAMVEMKDVRYLDSSIPLVLSFTSSFKAENIYVERCSINVSPILECESGQSIHIGNSTFKNNQAAAIFIKSAQQTSLTTNHFIDNINYGTHGTLVSVSLTNLSISHSSYVNNIGYNSIQLSSNTKIHLFNNSFTGNSFGSQLTIENTVSTVSILTTLVAGSHSQSSIAIILNDNPQVLVKKLVVSDCGQVYSIHRSAVEMQDHSFFGLVSSQPIIDMYRSSGSMENSFLTNITVTMFNSTLWMSESSFTFRDLKFFQSYATLYPLGYYINSNISIINSLTSGCSGSVQGGLYALNSTLVYQDVSSRVNKGSVIKGINSTVYIGDSDFKYSLPDSSEVVVELQDCLFHIFKTSFTDINQMMGLRISNSNGTITEMDVQEGSGIDSLIMINKKSLVSIEDSNFFVGYSDTFSALKIDGYSVAIISNCRFQMAGINVPVLSIHFSTVSINSTKFFGCENSRGNGGAIGIYQSSVSIYGDTKFIQMKSVYGGSIYSEGSSLFIQDSYFNGSSAQSGGIIYLLNSNMTATNTSFLYSSAVNLNLGAVAMVSEYTQAVDYSGGALTVDSIGNSNNSLQLFSCQLVGNSAVNSGGAIHINHPRLSLDVFNNKFILNSARGGGGGAIYFQIVNNNENVNNSNVGNQFQYNMGIYGDNVASTGTKLIIHSPLIQNATVFTLKGLVLDQYQQEAILDPSYVFGLNISTFRVYDDGNTTFEYIISKQSVPVLGVAVYPLSLTGDIGQIYFAQMNITDRDQNLILYNYTFLKMNGCTNQQYLDNSHCDSCPIGTVPYNGVDCYLCPTKETSCPSGVLLPNKGYWFDQDVKNNGGQFPPHYYKCDSTICWQDQCRPLHTGILCGQCIKGAHKSILFCVECIKTNRLIITGYVIFMILFTLVLSRVQYPSRTILLPTILFLQLLAIIGERTSEHFYLFPLFNFRLDYIPSTCSSPNLDYLSKYFISISTIIIVFFTSLIIPYIGIMNRILRITFKPTPISKRMISLIPIFYLPLTYLSSSTIPCTSVLHHYYLLFDQSIQCFTQTHNITITISSIIIITISFILPIYLFKRMYHPNHHAPFLHLKRQYRYWELLRMFMSFVLVWIFILLPFYESIQSLVISSMSIIYFIHIWTVSPFNSLLRNSLESLFSTIFMISCLLVNSRLTGSQEDLGYILIAMSIIIIIVSLLYHCIKVYPGRKRKTIVKSTSRFKFQTISSK